MSDATLTLSPTENVIKTDSRVDGHDPWSFRGVMPPVCGPQKPS